MAHSTTTTMQQITTTTTTQSTTITTDTPTSTLTSVTNAVKNTTSNPNNFQFMDFCPGAAKTIDCSTSGEFVFIVDAFHGVSDQVPAVCEYK